MTLVSEYHILFESSASAMEKKLSNLALLGWKPCGNLIVAGVDLHGHYSFCILLSRDKIPERN